MHICRSAEAVTVHAPAKLNLFFEVLAKRPDGYHEIETLMCPIDLYDTITFREDFSGQVRLSCKQVFGAAGRRRVRPEATGVDVLPEGQNNLVVKAVELVRQAAGADRGASVRLIKRIPMAAGLGGGSSDAAAALLAANAGWGLDLGPDVLFRLAAQLGSDVPFFLAGSAAICRGRGERVEPVPYGAGMHFVVARPEVGLSTAAVYAACRPAEQPRQVAPLCAALGRRNVRQVGGLLWNRLQPAAAALCPAVEELDRTFSELGLPGYGMSGSGTAYFGLCRRASHAQHMARRLRANGVWNVFAVRSCR
ncbi:MAG: 4-(cytidine 5'-diphospho)-2-C-methyl-D-erythritol kinase [Thermoguttaceae bacterium]|jgi:4-diphosphocytidyl-2-C-methyl-D-erythritol kinase|nr:4-(cytidine 5'-diphospho)-2-C-methyl-D-erythritol kinase [Thermoguttaceae bacterium]